MTSLVEAFATLAPWPSEGGLSPAEWDRHVAVAGTVRGADPEDVAGALAEFLDRRKGLGSDDDETRLFLLMRVVFDLPETAPAEERRSFKGWTNWPPPDPDGMVSLAWPLTWAGGQPALVDPYEGSEGPRYAGVEEYRHLLGGFPFRTL